MGLLYTIHSELTNLFYGAPLVLRCQPRSSGSVLVKQLSGLPLMPSVTFCSSLVPVCSVSWAAESRDT